MLALVLVVSAGAAQAVQFWNLGAGRSTGMTSDGQVVSLNQSSSAKIWSPQYGVVSLGSGSTSGVTWNGSSLVVAGKSGGTTSRWDGSKSGTGSWSALPQTDGGYNWSPAPISAIASDGNQVMIVGSYNYSSGGSDYFGGVRYKHDGTVGWTTRFGVPVGYHDNSILYGVSEGDVTTGRAQYAGSGPTGGSRQPIVGSSIGLGNLLGGPSHLNEACAMAISGDGSRIVGWAEYPAGTYRACYWDAPYTNGKMATAIPLVSGYYWAEATAVSRTGAFIGGAMWLNGDAGQSSFIWDAVNGTRELKSYLISLGVDLTGWQLSNDYADGAGFFAISGISEDGKWITGTGIYNGTETAWAVAIPEPGSVSVLAMGLLGLIGIYRRRS